MVKIPANVDATKAAGPATKPTDTKPIETKPTATNGAKIKENDPMPENTKPTVSLSFEDADTMPGAQELNAVTNPFQEKVNELAQSGKATSFVVPDGDVATCREQIRRAANNIDKGAKTKPVPEKGRDGYTRIWFEVGTKVKRPRKNG